MATALQILKTNTQAALSFLRDEIRAELSAQGHHASGKLIEEIDIVISQKADDLFSGAILMEDYHVFVNNPVKPHWPPYQAIYEWAGYVQPSLDEKERKSFAFAVQRTIAEEGIPSRGAYSFTSNGRRLMFTQFAIDNNQDQFRDILDLFGIMRAFLDESIAELQQKLAA